MADGCPDSVIECITYTLVRFPFYDCGDLIFSYDPARFLHSIPRSRSRLTPPAAATRFTSSWLASSGSLTPPRPSRRSSPLLLPPSHQLASLLLQVETKIVWAAIFLGFSMLLSCRFHYSIDILIAIYFTVAAWFGWNYVHMVDAGFLTSAVR